MRATILTVTTVLALGGCVVVPGDEGGGGLFGGDFSLGSSDRDGGAFRCEGGRNLSVDVDRDGERARVRTDGGRDYDLDYAGRDGGASRYEGRSGGDRVALTIDDDDAYLRVEDGNDYKDCRRTGGGFFGRDRSRGDERRRGRDEVAYRCDDGRSFLADFGRGDERVLIDTGRRTLNLDLVDQDGRRRVYRDGGVTLTVERSSAYLRVKDGNDYKDCRVAR